MALLGNAGVRGLAILDADLVYQDLLADGAKEAAAVRGSLNSTPTGVDSISFGSPHVRCTPVGVHRTRDEPNEIKKNTHPKNATALLRGQARYGFAVQGQGARVNRAVK